MYIERSTDYALIRRVMTHPRVYPHITDDFSPLPEDYRPIESDAVIYLTVYDGDELLGLFLFAPITGACLEVHTCVLPTAWGARATKAAQAATSWVWTNTPAARLVTTVPESNRLAHRFARAAGMTEYGRNPGAIRKSGRLEDLILLGRSRPQE